MPIFKKNSQGKSKQNISPTLFPKESLLPTENIINLAKKAGVDFGPGNANERIRYFIKLGILPHAIRKLPALPASFDREARRAGRSRTTNHEPLTKEEVKTLLLLLAPFAPHMTEELWQIRVQGLGSRVQGFKSIHLEQWPEFVEELTKQDEIILVIQVNGKVRDKVITNRGISKDEAVDLAKKSTNVSKYIAESKVKKVIYVEDKLLNFVIN